MSFTPTALPVPVGTVKAAPPAEPTPEQVEDFEERMRSVLLRMSMALDQPRARAALIAAVRSGKAVALQVDDLWGKSWGEVEDKLVEVVGDVLVRSGAAELTRMNANLSFNLENPYAARYAREQVATLVTVVSEETKATIRDVVARGFEQGTDENGRTRNLTDDEIARALRPLIGLNRPQAKRYAKREADLAAEGLTGQALVDALEAFRAKLIRERARLIARTEVMFAQNKGHTAAWLTARDEGLLLDTTERIWISSPSSPRTCPACMRMHGLKAPVDAPFVSPDFGEVMEPPLHPACRCTVGLWTPEPEEAGWFEDGNVDPGFAAEPPVTPLTPAQLADLPPPPKTPRDRREAPPAETVMREPAPKDTPPAPASSAPPAVPYEPPAAPPPPPPVYVPPAPPIDRTPPAPPRTLTPTTTVTPPKKPRPRTLADADDARDGAGTYKHAPRTANDLTRRTAALLREEFGDEVHVGSFDLKGIKGKNGVLLGTHSAADGAIKVHTRLGAELDKAMRGEPHDAKAAAKAVATIAHEHLHALGPWKAVLDADGSWQRARDEFERLKAAKAPAVEQLAAVRRANALMAKFRDAPTTAAYSTTHGRVLEEGAVELTAVRRFSSIAERMGAPIDPALGPKRKWARGADGGWWLEEQEHAYTSEVGYVETLCRFAGGKRGFGPLDEGGAKSQEALAGLLYRWNPLERPRLIATAIVDAHRTRNDSPALREARATLLERAVIAHARATSGARSVFESILDAPDEQALDDLRRKYGWR